MVSALLGTLNQVYNIKTQHLVSFNKYRKFPKYFDTPKNCCNHSKIWTMWLYHRVMRPNDADGMANSVDPDKTAPLGAVWSGSALFAQAYLSENLGSLRQSKTYSKTIYFQSFLCILTRVFNFKMVFFVSLVYIAELNFCCDAKKKKKISSCEDMHGSCYVLAAYTCLIVKVLIQTFVH